MTLSSTNRLNDRIFIRNGNCQYVVHLVNIIYIASSGETSKIFVVGQDNPITVTGNLGKVLNHLSSICDCFERVSRYHLVNIRRVAQIIPSNNENNSKVKRGKKYLILLDSDAQIPLTEKFRTRVLKRLNFL